MQQPRSENKGRTTIAIKKKITHKRLNIKTTIQVVALEVYLIGKRKRTVCYISTPNRPGDRGRYERTPGAAPSTYDPAGRFQRTQSTMGKRENEHKRENDEKILDRYNLLCIKKKKKPTTEQVVK